MPHPAVFRSPSRRAGHFLLSGQEKVTKEKATPRARLPGILPSRCAIGLRGSLNIRPCTCSELARIVRAILTDFSYAQSPRPRGPGVAHSPCAQKQERWAVGGVVRLLCWALLGSAWLGSGSRF